MVDVANSLSTLNGIFKEVYGSAVEDLLPGSAKLARKIGFVPDSEREGAAFNFPVVLTREHGYALSSASTDPFALQDAEAAVHRNARIQGVQFALKSLVSYAAMSDALKSTGENRTRAFVMATKHVVENMVESAAFVREIQMIHGGGSGAEAANVGGIGVVSAVSGAGPFTLTISDESWAAGIWAGMENGYVDVYDTTLATKRNSTDLQVTDVDVANKQIEVTGTATGLAATDVVYLRTAQANEMAGLKRSITNTGSLHGISATTYNLWGGNSNSAGSAAFTFQKLLSAINEAVSRGLYEDVCCVISPATWSDLLNDLSSLRRYADRQGGTLTQGADAIQYYSQNGLVEIMPHIFMKDGEACIFPPARVHRVGSTDITFLLPGGEDKFLVPTLTNTAYAMQCYWKQSVIVKHPAKCTYVTGIVNAT